MERVWCAVLTRLRRQKKRQDSAWGRQYRTEMGKRQNKQTGRQTKMKLKEFFFGWLVGGVGWDGGGVALCVGTTAVAISTAVTAVTARTTLTRCGVFSE